MAASKSLLKVSKLPDGVSIHPKAELVASQVEPLRDSLQAALAGVKGKVVLDLDGITQIDSMGVTLILGLYKSAQNQGHSFSVVGVDRNLVRVFRLFSLTKFFPVEEAVAHE